MVQFEKSAEALCVLDYIPKVPTEIEDAGKRSWENSSASHEDLGRKNLLFNTCANTNSSVLINKCNLEMSAIQRLTKAWLTKDSLK